MSGRVAVMDEGMSEGFCVLPLRLHPQCVPPRLSCGAGPSHRGPGSRTFSGVWATNWGPEKGEHPGQPQPDCADSLGTQAHTCTHSPHTHTHTLMCTCA